MRSGDAGGGGGGWRPSQSASDGVAKALRRRVAVQLLPWARIIAVHGTSGPSICAGLAPPLGYTAGPDARAGLELHPGPGAGMRSMAEEDWVALYS